MTSGTDTRHDETESRSLINDRARSALVVLGGAAMMAGLAVGAMAMLTSPDSWVMKAANQAMLDQQQAVATSYLVNHGE